MVDNKIEKCVSDRRDNGTTDFINRIRQYYYKKRIKEVKEEIAQLDAYIAQLDKKKEELLAQRQRRK